MVDHLTESLGEEGINVERFDLTVYDTGRYCSALVDAATIVVASPSFLAGAHPMVIGSAFLASSLRPKLKFAAIMGSYGWGSKMVDQVKGVMGGLKVEYLEPVLIKGEPKEESIGELERLAREIKEAHVSAGIN
jgi:flavorubredoxin